jgi:Met-zincin/Domain of unknown function (DUF5117)
MIPRALPPIVLLLACACAAPGGADRSSQVQEPAQTGIAARVNGFEHLPGLFELYLEREQGRAWLRLPAPDGAGVYATCLYYEGLGTGLGSNPVGLDRGQVRGPWLIRFRQVGGKVLIERPNLAFRARSSDEHERRATRESFATSVLWAAPVEERDPDGGVLIELTSFLVRDAHGVAKTLGWDGGSWSLDAGRSVVDTEACLAFPDNLELEALLTFKGSNAGPNVRATSPDAGAVSLVLHHSFIRLPPAGYSPRRFDPRAGSFSVTFKDYAAPLTDTIDVALAARHRLRKRDPRAARSQPVEPIVYYVDRGAPEPIRSALLEGAGWWSEAFDQAGFEGAFRVELLPEGAHPLDVRYNVIQWVHRSTRGWSYGNAVTDPRTGEILKGHVSLGSLRVRQDRRLFEGLAGTSKTGTGVADDPIELALGRIRQLAAHEVGHTLGFAHNFSASVMDRASVMDYPAPLVTVGEDGELDFSDAYGVGIGAWDKVAVAWLYGEFPADQEAAALGAILAEASARGLRYHSDSDARPPGAAQPYANLWDNFADPVTGLENTLAVRAVGLARFGEDRLSAGLPRVQLEEVLAPVYFHHRYQVQAAVKMLGGVDYEHVLAGQGGAPAVPIPADLQRAASAALLRALDPAQLDLPESILRLLGPRPPGAGRDREQFGSQAGPLFDPLAAAGSAAGLVVDGLLQPERCARLVDQHRRAGELPSLEEVLEALTDAAFAPGSGAEREAEIGREVQRVVVGRLVRLAQNGRAPERVRARASGRLRRLLEESRWDGAGSEAEFAHRASLREAIQRHLSRQGAVAAPLPAPLDAPPGSPIGSGSSPGGACDA